MVDQNQEDKTSSEPTKFKGGQMLGLLLTLGVVIGFFIWWLIKWGGGPPLDHY